jgi:DNA polymerase iota
MSSRTLDKLLRSPGSEKGIGEKVWGLLHGVDDVEVKAASDVPTQISIENTYKGLNERWEINHEIRRLGASLLRRMRVDLVEDDKHDGDPTARKWIAHPKTVRLSTRPKTSPGDGRVYNWGRASKSQSLPSFVFGFSANGEEIVERLAAETLLPMFFKLNPQERGWNIGLINVCVTNIVLSGTDDGTGSGRDISVMFRRQKDVLQQWTVYETCPPPWEDRGDDSHEKSERDIVLKRHPDPVEWIDDDDFMEDRGFPAENCNGNVREGLEKCPRCGHLIPIFALTAHERYHTMGE